MIQHQFIDLMIETMVLNIHIILGYLLIIYFINKTSINIYGIKEIKILIMHPKINQEFLIQTIPLVYILNLILTYYLFLLILIII